MEYLEFADITDFSDPEAIKDFKEINFSEERNVSENATDNESSGEEFESKYHLGVSLFGQRIQELGSNHRIESDSIRSFTQLANSIDPRTEVEEEKDSN